MPIKDRKTKILLMLFLNSDVRFDYCAITVEMQSIFDISLNQKTKGTLSALIRDGYVEKNAEGNYRLLPQGFSRLCLEFPFFRFLWEEWDGLWRVISYEIPESKREIRDSLRREMKGWGLGPWHRSFWLTPHPVLSALRDLVYGKEEEVYIQAFEATHVFGDKEVLIERTKV